MMGRSVSDGGPASFSIEDVARLEEQIQHDLIRVAGVEVSLRKTVLHCIETTDAAIGCVAHEIKIRVDDGRQLHHLQFRIGLPPERQQPAGGLLARPGRSGL